MAMKIEDNMTAGISNFNHGYSVSHMNGQDEDTHNSNVSRVQ